jgi:hypothetical protein
MALHYLLLPLKFFVLFNVLIEINLCFLNKQRLFLNAKPLSIFTILPSSHTSFFHVLIACKQTSKYTFINQYLRLANAQSGGGGHGNDHRVIPNYYCHLTL